MKANCLLFLFLIFPFLVGGTVIIEGEVNNPGKYKLSEEKKLFDILVASEVTQSSFVFGAFFSRKENINLYKKIKYEAIYDINLYNSVLKSKGNKSIEFVKYLEELEDFIGLLDETGRVFGYYLDPQVIELNKKNNVRLIDGDYIFFPPVPNFINIVGGKDFICRENFNPDFPVRKYLEKCGPSEFSDKSWVYLIQASGEVYKLGKASWNLSKDIYPSPGATIFYPVRNLKEFSNFNMRGYFGGIFQRMLESFNIRNKEISTSETLNENIAKLIAYQPISSLSKINE